MPVVIVCCIIIALAVAPQAILNLARLIDWILELILRVLGIVVPIAFFWWLFTR